MVTHKPHRVEIGFGGGQVMVARLSEAAYEALAKAVKDGGGWYDLDSEDGPVALDLDQVVFVKTETAEHRIGFGGE